MAAAVTGLLLATAACAGQLPAAAGRPEVVALPVRGTGGAGGLLPPREPGRLRLEGAWELTASDPAFGGISAAALAGDRLLLLGDRSRLFALAWSWPVPGRPFRAPILADDALRDRAGRPLDAEALAVLPDGGRLVADEGAGRLVPFAAAGPASGNGAPVPLAGLDGGAANQGVEALARLPDGQLLALGEAAGSDGLHPALLLGGGAVRRLRYRSADGFRPTDAAAVGPWLLVLERRVSLLAGWQARLAALPLAEVARAPSSGTLEGTELGRVAGADLGENYEALAAESDGGAGYRVLLVADDNFSAVQRTLLLTFRWLPAAAAGPA